jgi:hypothetical protein
MRVAEDYAYAWIPLQTLTTAKALLNSDSYAYFGALAVIADRKYRLSTVPEDAEAGVLEHDPDGIPSKHRRSTFTRCNSTGSSKLGKVCVDFRG